ncbi:IRAK3 [Branchiostoma lanceolatum]|uniref:non-specific serine/threonine protein kinase n=1 Tax=Branchiostoma lanceolatum TaxID=7740 RepID=A0A8J9ZZU8_BRALA|nr:IRAK3 [Branchiostoma lanceolatum]
MAALAVSSMKTSGYTPTTSRSPSPQTKVAVGDIEYSKRRRLKDLLDPKHHWEDVAGRLDYSQDEISAFDLDYRRPDGSPTMRLLDHLGQKNVSVNKLFVVMCECELNRAAEVLKPLVDSKYHGYLRNEEDPPVPSMQSDENISKLSNNFGAMTFENQGTSASMDSLPLPGPPPPMLPGPASPPNHRVCQPHQEPRGREEDGNQGQPKETWEEAQERLKDVDKGFTLAKMPHFFYKDLEEGTKGFSPANLLGEGTFGRVFRANVFKTIFAVKCLRQNDEDITQERKGRKFQFNELAKLMQFRHPNLLPLHGYSLDGLVPCLVTEYMLNGSLEDRLQCKDRTAGLKWELRMNITKGVARGLQFLHTVKDPPLIHGDVKSSNILLDRHYEAKIGDFGLARDGPSGSLKSYTIMKTDSKIMGTTAYIAPEYCRNRVLSREVDTYAFGVVVFEVLTGQKAFDETRGRHRVLSDLVQDHMDTNDPDMTWKLVDKKTGKTAWPRDTALGLFEIGRQCTLHKRKQRPKMPDVLSRLEKMEVRRQLSKEGVSLMSSLSSSPDVPRRTRQEPQESESPSLASGSPIVGPSPCPPSSQSSSHEPIESDELAWNKEDNKDVVGHCGNQKVERVTGQPSNSYPSQSTISTDLESNGVVSHQQNVENLASPPDTKKEDNRGSLPLPLGKQDPNASGTVVTGKEQSKDEEQDRDSLKKGNLPPNRPVEAWMPDSILRNTDGKGGKSASEEKFPSKDVSKLDNMSSPSRQPGGRKLSPCESDDCPSMARPGQSPVKFHAKADVENMVKPQVNQPANTAGSYSVVSPSEQPARITPSREGLESTGRDGDLVPSGMAGSPTDKNHRQHFLPAYPPGYGPLDDKASRYPPVPFPGGQWGYPHHQNLPTGEAGMSPAPQNGYPMVYGVTQPYGPHFGQTSPAVGPAEVPYLPHNNMPYGPHAFLPQYPPYDIPPSQHQRADIQDPYPQYVPEPHRMYPGHPPTRFNICPPSPDSSCSNQQSTASSSSSQSSSPQSSVSREGSSGCTTFTDSSSGLSSQTTAEPNSGLSGDVTSSMSLPETSSVESLPMSDERSIRFTPEFNEARNRLLQDMKDYDEGRLNSEQCFGNIPSESDSLGELSLEQSETGSSRVPTEDSDDSTSC